MSERLVIKTLEVIMGKLIISTHMTVDGIIGPNPGEWGIFEGEGERFKFTFG